MGSSQKVENHKETKVRIFPASYQIRWRTNQRLLKKKKRLCIFSFPKIKDMIETQAGMTGRANVALKIIMRSRGLFNILHVVSKEPKKQHLWDWSDPKNLSSSLNEPLRCVQRHLSEDIWQTLSIPNGHHIELYQREGTSEEGNLYFFFGSALALGQSLSFSSVNQPNRVTVPWN